MNTIVEKYLKELLFDFDCVIIPNFGGFISTYMSSEISIAKNKITPARKQIKFNEKLLANDSLLIDYIAENENISILEAYKQVEIYILDVKEQIKDKSQYTIESLGRIYLNEEKNYSFEQYLKFNYLKESFGLPDLYFKPIDRTQDSKILYKPKKQRLMASNIENELEDDESENQYDESEYEMEEVDLEEFERQKQQKKSENLAIYYIMAVMALVLTAGTAYYLNMDKTTYAIGSFSPLSWFGKSEVDTTSIADNKLLPSEPADQPADGETTLEEANIQPETSQGNTSTEGVSNYSKSSETATNSSSGIDPSNLVSAKTGRYYIIAGGFKNKRKATSFVNKLINEGNPSKVIDSYDESGVYRVTIADFSTYEQAQAQRKSYADSYGEELWVLNY